MKENELIITEEKNLDISNGLTPQNPLYDVLCADIAYQSGRTDESAIQTALDNLVRYMDANGGISSIEQLISK